VLAGTRASGYPHWVYSFRSPVSTESLKEPGGFPANASSLRGREPEGEFPFLTFRRAITCTRLRQCEPLPPVFVVQNLFAGRGEILRPKGAAFSTHSSNTFPSLLSLGVQLPTGFAASNLQGLQMTTNPGRSVAGVQTGNSGFMAGSSRLAPIPDGHPPREIPLSLFAVGGIHRGQCHTVDSPRLSRR